MKICANCGAEYQNKLRQCPYCGVLNSQAVQKQHEAKRRKLKEESEQIKRLPQMIPKKSSRYLVWGGLGLLVVFFVMLIAIFISESLRYSVKEEQEQINIETMEEYLSQGDFEGLYDFYGEIEYSYAVYDKYREVCEFYSSYEMIRMSLDMVREYGGLADKELMLDEIVEAMVGLREMCDAAKEAGSDNRRLNNEEYIEQIKTLSIEDFKEMLQVEEQIVEQVLEVSKKDAEVVYGTISKQLYEKLEKINFGRTE